MLAVRVQDVTDKPVGTQQDEFSRRDRWRFLLGYVVTTVSFGLDLKHTRDEADGVRGNLAQ